MDDAAARYKAFILVALGSILAGCNLAGEEKMPEYNFNVIEVCAAEMRYTVEADNEQEAREKAERGKR